MATHSSTLALKIPWTEELGAGYYPWSRLGVAGRLSGTVSPFRAEQGTSLETPSWQPTPVFLPGESHGHARVRHDLATKASPVG